MNPEEPAGHSEQGCLVLEGAVTVRAIEPVHARLVDLLNRHDTVEIDCTALTEADLSLVQLLLAARRSAMRDGKTLVLTAPASGALRQTLSIGGFLPADASPADAETAFWLKGKDGR